jgi:hypothetical protein
VLATGGHAILCGMTDGGGITVGRHAADDGAEVHPLVAAALEARQAPMTGTHRFDRPAVAGTTSDGEGGLGWPGSPGDGSGLGWPADADARAATPVGAPAPKRSVWRRLFGVPEKDRTSVEQARQGSTAA